jgi:hypothetical protein
MRSRLPLLLAAGLSAWHFSTFDIAELPLVTDTRYYLYFAWQMTEGAVPHLDFFDPKTQLATFVGALLHALASALSLDPLLAVRAGFLTVAALAGAVVFEVHRRLFGGSAVAGFLGLLAYLSFSVLGALIALGNSPKLLLSLFAYLMALCVWKGRWLLAGLLGALAFMDWQVGALVWFAALAAALILEKERRRACLRLVAGGAIGLAPFLAYFALNGALGAAFEQTVVGAFFRGSGTLAQVSLGERLDRIAGLIEDYFAGRQWLPYLSLVGIPCALFHLRRRADSGAVRLLLPLCLYHGGILAFSAVDFQGHGDFLLLLFTLSFLLAMAWNVLYGEIDRRLARRVGPRARTALAAALLLLAVGVSRPALLRPEVAISRLGRLGVRLEDQREVAAAVGEWSQGRRIVLLANAELLYLMRRGNPLPIIYWNRAAWTVYRRPGEESGEATLGRMLEEADPEVHLYPQRHAAPIPYLERFTPRPFRSRNGRYQVELLERREASVPHGEPPLTGGELELGE